MTNKNDAISRNERLQYITNIICEEKISNHEELITKLLERYGVSISQATVSRDLNKLKIEKDDSGCFTLSSAGAMLFHQKDKIEQVFKENVKTILTEPRTIAIKTRPGYARSTAVLLEEVFKDKIYGTISGEDSLIIIVREENLDYVKSNLTPFLK